MLTQSIQIMGYITERLFWTANMAKSNVKGENIKQGGDKSQSYQDCKAEKDLELREVKQ